jgi:hypothetical protein
LRVAHVGLRLLVGGEATASEGSMFSKIVVAADEECVPPAR